MSDPSVGYVGQGQFVVIVNGQQKTMSIGDMNLMLRMEQVEQWDKEIADQFAEIQQANNKRKQLNGLISAMRSAKENLRNDDIHKISLEGFPASEKRTIHHWLELQGFKQGDGGFVDITRGDVSKATSKDAKQADKDVVRSKWDANIELVKSKIDALSSDTELKMLRFRQLVDKRGTAMQEAKSTLQQEKRLKDSILQ